MIAPAVAAVRPRIVSPTTGDALLLEDFVFTSAAKFSRGSIHIGGPVGSGKTAALRHLAATVLPHFPILLLDDPDLVEVTLQSTHRLVVYTHRNPIPNELNRRMARWGDDDLIEYLLARHPDHASSVFRRIRDAVDRSLMQGLPEISRIVIDRMARDETIVSVANTLRLVVNDAGEELGDRTLASKYCAEFLDMEGSFSKVSEATRDHCFTRTSIPKESYLGRLLGFSSVRKITTADLIVDELKRQGLTFKMARHLTREVVDQVASQVSSMPQVIDYLEELTRNRMTIAPVAASILHATGAPWCPNHPRLNLCGAFLSGARWQGASLADADLRRADLSSADLSHADLACSRADSANLESASLAESSISGCRFVATNLSSANFRAASGSNAMFSRSDLSDADFRDCELPKALFRAARLRNASFAGANLRQAILTDCDIEDADFTNVDFRNAVLRNNRLRLARLDGAIFSGADLRGCDLECIQLDNARFDRSALRGAYLTGSVLPRADFRDADLTESGLGDIDWEGADLRNANLKDCSFHMGSTRCGLVDSPYPSEGTRTGFYTDDYDDQYFKAPEEIRKANLRGANLLGANILGIDFYLVDMRDAIYDDSQRAHFMRTGAILHARRCE